MGYLASASTIYARAYLTSRGREYLFNNGNIRFNNLGQDLFRITTFTLGDPDMNYETSELLPAGHVPDVSGKYDTCLKTALDYEQRNLLFHRNFDQVVTEDIDYTTNANGNLVNVDVNIGTNDILVGPDNTNTNTNTNVIPNVDRNGNTLDNNGNVVVTRPNGGQVQGDTNANNVRR